MYNDSQVCKIIIKRWLFKFVSAYDKTHFCIEIYIISWVFIKQQIHVLYISVIHMWHSIVLFSFIFLEKCNSVLRKNHLAINLDSLKGVRDKRIDEKKTTKEDGKMTKHAKSTWEKNEKCTGVNRTRGKSPVRWACIGSRSFRFAGAHQSELFRRP